MSKTLWCENGQHKYMHPGGRGRPPINCPEHKTAVKATDNDKPPADNPFITRATTIVAEPESPVAAPKENPFIKKAENRQRMEKARQGKEKKKEQIAAEDRARLEQEFEEIDARVRRAEEEYELAQQKFSHAQTAEEIEKAGRTWQTRQNVLLNLYNRQRKLYNMFEQETATDSNQEVTENATTA